MKIRILLLIPIIACLLWQCKNSNKPAEQKARNLASQLLVFSHNTKIKEEIDRIIKLKNRSDKAYIQIE